LYCGDVITAAAAITAGEDGSATILRLPTVAIFAHIPWSCAVVIETLARLIFCTLPQTYTGGHGSYLGCRVIILKGRLLTFFLETGGLTLASLTLALVS